MIPKKTFAAFSFATVVLASPVTLTAARAQDINDSAYDGLKAMITAEVQKECKAGSPATYSDAAFSLKGPGVVVVRLGGYSCQWEFTNHFFCGVRACEVREYTVQGSAVTLTKSYLE